MKKKTVPFKLSDEATIGIELEFQIINPSTFGLVSRARDLMHDIKESAYKKWIKPEITQSMIEINSSIHHSPKSMLDDLSDLQSFLLKQGEKLTICFCGGGTHPFQKWALQKIYPNKRFKNLSRQYRHLTKQATVFGQHIHIGCKSGDDAVYLTHAMGRYVPHLMALSASSPFYQGKDTHFHSARSTIFNAFPLSGVMPYLLNWNEFSHYFNKMRDMKIIATMKDFYWDIRPKPEFGTIEIRVCDTPLTIKKAVQLAAYAQALGSYLLNEKPLTIKPELYYFYSYNRFQASRYGFEGELILYDTLKSQIIYDDILETIEKIQPYAKQFDSEDFILALKNDVINKQNDARVIRELMRETNSLPQVVREQCRIWRGDQAVIP